MGVVALLAELEAISRCRSDRVLRLRGALLLACDRKRGAGHM
jgi:hypothetical protein